jgi:hypothetical protein
MLIRRNSDGTSTTIIGLTCVTTSDEIVSYPRVFTKELYVVDAHVVINTLNTKQITVEGNAHVEISDLSSRGYPDIIYKNTTEYTTLLINNIDQRDELNKKLFRKQKAYGTKHTEVNLDDEPSPVVFSIYNQSIIATIDDTDDGLQIGRLSSKRGE